MELTLSHVFKSYGSTPVLKDISLKLEAGKITGLLGANGAGKTTLLKILSAYFYPSEGSVSLNGVNAQEAPGEYRKTVGLLPDGAPLKGDKTAFQLISEERDYYENSLEGEEIDRLISLFDLESIMHSSVKKLSRGFRQRVGLLIALVGNPSLLLLDEPFSGLDPTQIKMLRSYLGEICPTKITLFSSHILQEVFSLSDRILIIKEGQIVGDFDCSTLSRWEDLEKQYMKLGGSNE